jgi:hypothetical protein
LGGGGLIDTVVKWLSASRVRYLSVVVVVLIWAQGAYLNIVDQAFVQEIARSLPRLAFYATARGVVLVLIVGGLLRLARENLGNIGFTSRRGSGCSV